MLNETWKEQYDRMQRSFALLQQSGERNAQPQDVIPARDVLYHFCSDALHLCDWIAATLGTDKASTETIKKQLTDDVIKPSPELSACADVANGFKHLALHRKSYVTGTNQGHAEVVSHGINVGLPTTRIEVKTSVDGVVTHPDGTTDANPPPVPSPEAPEPTHAPANEDGWVQDTFKIDINGQEHDAQDVATKAVAAWDQWLRGDSSLAKQLR
jgi:hypothetical protein